MSNTVPTGWCNTTLGEAVSLSKEKVDPKKVPDAPYVGLEHIEAGTTRLLGRGLASDTKSTKSVFHAGDVLYGKLRPYLNKAHLASFDGVCSTDILVFRRTEAIEPGYLLRVVSDPRFSRYATERSKGINLPRASFSALSDFGFGLPPLNEQHRVVGKIEALAVKSRRAKEALDAIPPLLESFRQSVLAAALRGDLTADWRAQNPNVEPADQLLARIRKERRSRWEQAELAKMRAKGKEPKNNKWKAKYKEPEPVDIEDLPELPFGWCWTRWQEVGFCQNGRAFPSKEYSETGVKLLRPGNLHVSGDVRWLSDATRHLPEEWATKHPEHIVRGGELIMNLTAQSLRDEFLGRICVTPEDDRSLLNQRLARLTPVGVSRKFAFWLFKSPLFRRFVDGLNTGSLIQHMFTSNVYEFVFPMPPADEQSVLVERLEGLHGRLGVLWGMHEAASTGLPALGKAVLAQAFRGTLVDQDPTDEPASLLIERNRVVAESKCQKKTKKPKAASVR